MEQRKEVVKEQKADLKAAKEAKRKNLLKEILSEKDGREGGGGDTYVGEATSLPVSLGRPRRPNFSEQWRRPAVL